MYDLGRASERACGAVGGTLWMCFVMPVAAVGFLAVAAGSIATLVFAIQGLVVGTATYQGPACQYQIAVWMLVSGSFIVGNVFVGCCTYKKRDEPGAEPPTILQNCCGCLSALIGLFLFGWLIYGVALVYGDQRFALQACNPSQYEVFRVIVMFDFWFMIAVLCFSLFVCLCVLPVAGSVMSPN